LLAAGDLGRGAPCENQQGEQTSIIWYGNSSEPPSAVGESIKDKVFMLSNDPHFIPAKKLGF